MVLCVMMLLMAEVAVAGTQSYYDVSLEKKLTKQRHKAEREALKLRSKYQDQALKGAQIPKSERMRIQEERKMEK